MIPFQVVMKAIANLDEATWNTLPKQPPLKPRQPGASKPPTPAKPQSSKSSEPPEEDPLEEQNIWAEILKLEGRQSCNRIAEGFVYWLDKNMDSTVYEVKIFFIYNLAFLHLSWIIDFLAHSLFTCI